MNIENLRKYEGTTETIKNYKKLCEILEIKVSAGDTKIAQLNELERFVKYHREGNKFIVDEIYYTPKEREESRGKSEGSRNNNTIEYIKNIETLILNLLTQEGNKNGLGFGKVFLSKNQLLKEFKMINDNYVFCKRRTNKLSVFMDICPETVEEWYEVTDDLLERNLETALKSLEKQLLVLWSKEITVVEAIALAEIMDDGKHFVKTKNIDEYGEETIGYSYQADSRVQLNYREGTEAEKTFILHTEKEILDELNCKNKQEVIKMGMWETFKDKVNNVVLKNLEIVFYYKSYKILFNEDHILKAVRNLREEFKLSKDEKSKEQNILNISILDRNMENANKRQIKALEDKSKIFGESNDNNYNHIRMERRISDEYIFDNENLNKNLIKSNCIDIKTKVKKTKLGLSESDEKQMDELFGRLD